ANPDTSDADGDGYPASEDCDDDNPDVNPGATEIPGDGIDNDCDPSTCAGTGYSGAVTELTLPEGYGVRTFAAAGNAGDCDGDRPRWTFADITGDGRSDIVVVRSPCGDVDPGLTTWTVHEASDTGFGDGIEWTLPTEIPAGLLQRPGNLPGCTGNNQPRWALRDITGDARPDIVFTQSCEDASVIGTTQWRVFANTGTGFADESALSLPSGYPEGTLDAFDSQPDCATGRPGYSLLDLDNDGEFDLVITATPCEDDDPGITHWSVHENTGTGFSNIPTSFTLPGSYATGTFSAPGHGGSCSDGIPRWSAVDLDGDTFLDAVVTWRDCDETVVGTTEWRVHAGSATGFASAPTTWTLPTGYGLNAFSAVAGDLSCPDARPRYQLLDMEADGRLELVVLRSPCEDDDVGTARWLVHRSADTMFSSMPDDWLLPEAYGDGTFHRVGAERQCAPEIPGWLPADPNQDGLQDILVNSSACLDNAIGDTVWGVHEGGCAL
ncbi:MAG TPA: hypothetical protein DFR83_04965, partial [Deltaproteobacteria bacterium]|nr:hypothetical protein [Deltaproteobacteria bacterium]